MQFSCGRINFDRKKNRVDRRALSRYDFVWLFKWSWIKNAFNAYNKHIETKLHILLQCLDCSQKFVEVEIFFWVNNTQEDSREL